MDDEQRLTREQAEQVLGRAAQLAVRRDASSVTVKELEAAAEEVGIDKALVRQAASELSVSFADSGRRFGMQTRVTRQRSYGGKMQGEALERLMARLDRFFGAQGKRALTKDTASWTARHIHVTVEPDGDGTLVQISEPLVNTASSMASLALAGGGTMGFMFGAALGKTLALSKILSLMMGLPLAALLGGVALLLVQLRHRSRVNEIERSFDGALEVLGEQRALPRGE